MDCVGQHKYNCDSLQVENRMLKSEIVKLHQALIQMADKTTHPITQQIASATDRLDEIELSLDSVNVSFSYNNQQMTIENTDFHLANESFEKELSILKKRNKRNQWIFGGLVFITSGWVLGQLTD